jgi:cbb3-type cytochrome oxidase maturation protein
MTLWSAVALLFLTLMLGIGAWFLFMWAVKSGQFDDIEGPKYRIFDDDDLPVQEKQEEKEEENGGG